MHVDLLRLVYFYLRHSFEKTFFLVSFMGYYQISVLRCSFRIFLAIKNYSQALFLNVPSKCFRQRKHSANDLQRDPIPPCLSYLKTFCIKICESVSKSQQDYKTCLYKTYFVQRISELSICLS